MSGTEGICAQVRERLSALAEGDLPDALRRETEAHLAECAGCAAARARFDQTLAALGDLPRAAPPPDLPDRIDRALDHLRAPSGARSRAPRLRHAVAALLVAGIVVGIIRVIPGTRLPHPLETLDKREPAPAVSDSTETAAPRPRGAGEAPVSRSEPRSAGVRQEAVKKTAPEAEAPPPAARRDAGAPAGKDVQGAFRDEAGGVARKQARAGYHASPAERVDRLTEAMREGDRVVPAARESPRTLLLSRRGDHAWVAAIRDLARARPGDLAAAWETLTGNERTRVLDVWRRAAPPPDLARDLRRALAGAGSDAEKRVIRTLLDAAPS